MKNATVAVLFLLLIILLNHCTCRQRITEQELGIIELIKRSPELAAYKAAFNQKDTCLEYTKGGKATHALRRIGIVFSDKGLSRKEKEDSAKQLGVTVKPCFWEKAAYNDTLYQQLVKKYPQITTLSPQAMQHLLFVN